MMHKAAAAPVTEALTQTAKVRQEARPKIKRAMDVADQYAAMDAALRRR